MTSIKDYAKAYEPQQMKNIADLEKVSVSIDITTEIRENKDRQEYTVSFIIVDGIEHRVPPSVIEQLKIVLTEKPDTKSFKVLKTGEGMATKYTVVAN